MEKLNINIKAEEGVCRVNIIGDISSWNENSSENMRARCENLKASGVKDCILYMNTIGGDCFQANEIENILYEVFGGYMADGGAIVASAGSYLGIKAKKFDLARNGQLMIHKPRGGIHGTESDVESHLTLLKNMTKLYYDAYVAKTTKPESEFKEKWEAGDFWLNAAQAKEWGFINNIKDAVQIDDDTASAIQACGAPIVHNNKQPKKEKKMELKTIAISIGMSADVSEADFRAQVLANYEAANKYKVLKAEVETKAKQDKDTAITAVLNSALDHKKITADSQEHWRELLNSNFDATKAVLDSMDGLTEPLSASIDQSKKFDQSLLVAGKYKGKTYAELQDEDPEALMELQEKHPKVFDALFEAWKKSERL